MSTVNEERECVRIAGVAMLEKLRANCHKPHWRNGQPEEYVERLAEELDELREALADFRVGCEGESDDVERAAARVRAEAADVANFAAFIIDQMGAILFAPRDVVVDVLSDIGDGPADATRARDEFPEHGPAVDITGCDV